MIINEEQIHRIVAESLKRILSEKKVIKIPKKHSENPAPAPAQGAPMPEAPMPEAPMPTEPMPPTEDAGMMNDVAPMSDTDSMGGDMSMDGGSGDPKADYIKKMIDNLPPEDLKAAEGYIESLGKDNGGDAGDASAMGNDQMGGGMPMGESVIFTKRQLTRLNEDFGIENLNRTKEDDNRVEKKKNANVHRNSPFCSPKF